MSEKIKGHEEEPGVKMFQVVAMARFGVESRNVVVDIHPEVASVDTCEIISDDDGNELLGNSGSAFIKDLTLTDEIWDRERVVDGIMRFFRYDESRRGVVDKIIPKV